jgi:hypothetical protein
LTATGRVTNLAARLGDCASGDDRAVLAEASLMLLVIVVAARWTLRR